MSLPARVGDRMRLGAVAVAWHDTLVVDDEDLDDRRLDGWRTAQSIGLGLVLGLGLWIVIGFVAWPLLV